MDTAKWYEGNGLRNGQLVFETTSQFWVFVKENGDGTFRIASNDAVIRGHVRSHNLNAFTSFDEAEFALLDLSKQFIMTPVEVGS
jgi:hypothetical protein